MVVLTFRTDVKRLFDVAVHDRAKQNGTAQQKLATTQKSLLCRFLSENV